MRKHFSVVVAVISMTVVMLSSSPASAGPDEDAGCIGYQQIGAFDLIGPGGEKRDDIGQSILFMKEVPGKNVFCAVTFSGSATNDVSKPMTVKMGFYTPGSEAYPWPMQQGQYWDSGNYKGFAGGVWGKVPDDKCLAIYSNIVWNGNTFKRTIFTSRCY